MAPSDQDVERALAARLRSADFDIDTLKSIRKDVIKHLDLPDDFFKDQRWKQRSAEIVDKFEGIEIVPLTPQKQLSPKKNDSKEVTLRKVSPEKVSPKKVSPKKVSPKKEASPKSTPNGKKPKAEARRKNEEEEEEYSDVIDDEPAPARKRKTADDLTPASPSKKPKKEKGSTAKASTESKMKSSTKTKATKTKRGSAAAVVSDDPLEQKIATLKSWIVKCGVRKQWSRELQPYSTKKEQIAHLQKILADLGMTPRYSLEKAKRIKEEREFQAEVAQLRADAGGASGSEEDDDRAKSGPATRGRKVVAGNFSVDFLGDQSESD
ncbi:hypothetical protein BZA70DRAFT_174159 [Myxozyma melibiosi]|uniref:Transcriptional regulator n=1 Tax=Myxozyma melibiosi TaxID=54550 RepID=A0ABR1F5N0_9ASCO